MHLSVYMWQKNMFLLGENMTCFAAKLLKFGVVLDECSHAKSAAACQLDMFSINKHSLQNVKKNFLYSYFILYS